MAKGLLLAASGLFLAAGLGVLWYVREHTLPAAAPKDAAKDPAKDPAPASQPVKSAAAVPPAAVNDYLGVVVTPLSVDVDARLDGRIEEVKIRVGDPVKRDDILATIDVRAQKGELLVARAALQAAYAQEQHARIEEKQARDKLSRTEQLSQVVSKEELATARYQAQLASAQVSAAKANVAQSQAKVKQLEIELADADIRAPFDGVVGTRYVDPGALVRSGSPVARILGTTDLWVRFAIPEEQGRALAHGAALRVTVPTLNAVFDATVETVSPEVDPAARMIFAEAKLSLPEEWKGKVPAGAVARVAPKI